MLQHIKFEPPDEWWCIIFTMIYLLWGRSRKCIANNNNSCLPVDVCEEARRDSPSDVHEGSLRVEGSLPEELICGLGIVNLGSLSRHDGRDDFSSLKCYPSEIMQWEEGEERWKEKLWSCNSVLRTEPSSHGNWLTMMVTRFGLVRGGSANFSLRHSGLMLCFQSAQLNI